MQIIYNLSCIKGFNNFIEAGILNEECKKYYNIQPYSTKANESYIIVKYNKDILSQDLIPIYGLLRSIIISNGFILCFSPPKSISCENFIKKYPVKMDKIVAEEFIEGTMINVFYDPKYGLNGCWQIATRNTVGAEFGLYKWSCKTYNNMFLEACIYNKLHISSLNPKYCYSFIMQHPDNVILVPFKTPQLYLIGMYEIIQNQTNKEIIVIEQDINEVKKYGYWSLTTIKFPEIYNFTKYSDLIDKFASPNTSYNIMGVIIKNIETGERTKIRNPVFEEIHYFKGNYIGLQYQYLYLRYSGKLPEYLKLYPNKKQDMSKYRDHIHMFTNTLHKNYLSCYVKKEKKLQEFSKQYQYHIKNLHRYYLNELRENKKFITNKVVINYVNNLNPALIMYCLNYNMRKRYIDTIKTTLL